MKVQNKKSLISVPMILYVYWFYILACSICDIIYLPLYYLGFNEYNLIAMGITFVSVAIAGILLRRRVTFLSWINFKTIPYLVLIFTIAVLRGLAPDLSHDVSQGRVFWQEPGFQDNINYNVFPAGFTFFFPLADRLFYIPRVLLGYRMGTLFNAFLLTLIFLQVAELYQKLIGSVATEIERHQTCEWKKIVYRVLLSKYTLALMTVMTFYAIADLGTYMVDLCAMPLLIWMLTVAIEKARSRSLVFLLIYALSAGLSFALKLTNIIFIAPILAVFVYKNRKSITFPRFLACMLIGILPSAPYFLYAYTSTGNPIFWTFNAVFKSPYYVDANFKDTRWGPQTLLELILWPIHVIVDPQNRISEINKFPQIQLLLGSISALYILVHNIKEKLWYKRDTALAGFFIIFIILWLKSTGYARYGMICEILGVVLTAVCIVSWLNNTNIRKRLCAWCVWLLVFVQFIFNYATGALNIYDWSFREKITPSTLKSYYAINAVHLFSDRGLIGTEEQREKIDVFLSTNIKHSIMKAINAEVPIVNGRYIVNDLASLKEAKGIDYSKEYLGAVRELWEKGKGIYDVTVANEFDYLSEYANSVGAEIVNIEEVSGYFVGRDTPLLIEYAMTGVNNTQVSLAEQQIFEVPKGSSNVNISGIFCLPAYIRWEVPDTGVRITILTQDGSQVLYEKTFPQQTYITLDESFDLSDIQQPVKIIVDDPSGEEHNTVAINLKVTFQ